MGGQGARFLKMLRILTPLLACVAGAPAVSADERGGNSRAAGLFHQHCASCHGEGRLGGTGPALIPESLKRLQKEEAARTIAKGRAATQMPAFAGVLSEAEIAALATYIYSPLKESPVWGAEQMAASRVVFAAPPELSGPRYKADPLNLFVVVEAGDHHATILDGDTFTPIHRFKTRFALHGGPKFSPDGRFVFFGSRDGWITKYDLWTLNVVAEVRAGINLRNIAISADGKFIAAANYLPHSLVILSAEDLSVQKIFDVKDRAGRSSRVSAVYQARPRRSFIAALKDVPEIWEISTDPDAPPIHEGFVHSHEKGMVEALEAEAGLFRLRRIAVDEPIDDFFFDQKYRHLLGSSRDGKSAVVVNLNVGRTIAHVPMPGLPHLGAGVTWTYQGRRIMAAPHLKEGVISIIDMADWSVIKQIKTLGPGFFLRSHENSRYAWADVFFGPNRDAIHVIDKHTLEIVKTLRPAPGKTAAHVEFDRDGAHALVSIWDMEGAVVVYDAKTLEEVKRIPMVKPSGKYNVYNKITFSEGTSH